MKKILIIVLRILIVLWIGFWGLGAFAVFATGGELLTSLVSLILAIIGAPFLKTSFKKETVNTIENESQHMPTDLVFDKDNNKVFVYDKFKEYEFDLMTININLKDGINSKKGKVLECYIDGNYTKKIEVIFKSKADVERITPICDDIKNTRKSIEAEIRAKKAADYKKMLKNSKKIVFDTETTGVKMDGYDEILSLSIIDGDGNILFDHLIKPEHRKRWPNAEAINGISPAMVKEEKTISSYMPEIQEIFDNAELLIGYNLEFDIAFLENAGLVLRNQKQYDVMLEFARIYGQWDERHGDYKWQKLSKCASYYKYKWEGKSHTALADTKATLYCFNQMTK